MIAVRLIGGLGNQLFQYSAGRRLALRHGVDLVLDLGWFRHEAPSYATPRRYELDRVVPKTPTIELSPGDVDALERGRLLRTDLPKLQVLRQQDGVFAVDERVLQAGDDVLLVGYWQSEAYFADVAPSIRDGLSGASAVQVEDETLERVLASPSAVSVHFRRGDYAADPAAKAFHGLLGRDYYQRAIDHVTARVPSAVCVAFSDEPDWVEHELAADLQLTVVARGGGAVQELRLMSRCTHHVIANSSFSWWGAWLGEREQSVVVAPRRWFADAASDTTSIVPERWQRL